MAPGTTFPANARTGVRGSTGLVGLGPVVSPRSEAIPDGRIATGPSIAAATAREGTLATAPTGGAVAVVARHQGIDAGATTIVIAGSSSAFLGRTVTETGDRTQTGTVSTAFPRGGRTSATATLGGVDRIARTTVTTAAIFPGGAPGAVTAHLGAQGDVSKAIKEGTNVCTLTAARRPAF